MAKRGAFIVFEGLDRSGKSTQASRLLQALNEAGRKTHIFRFPDRAEPFGQVIDRYLRKEIDLNEHALHLAFSANRWEKADAIVEKINSGENVICDRYAFSGIAYSLAKGEASSARGIDLYGEAGLPTKWVRWADVGLPEPDLVLFFHVDAEVARSRGGFGDERLEQEELQRRVAAEMETLRADYWKTVNANRSLDEVAQEVQNIVDELVKRETLPPLGRLPPPPLP